MIPAIKLSIGFLAFLSIASAQPAKSYPVIGEIEVKDERLRELVDPDAPIEVISMGHNWSEGPVWIDDAEGGFLLFSDVPENTIYQWREAKGTSIYLTPSGYTGILPYSSEPGSNGLALDRQERLVLCEHGDRRVAVLTPMGGKMTLADLFEGKRFNSPNDLCIHSSGAVYFTDPPYGLPQREKDPTREMDFCGVFRISPEGEVQLMTDQLTRPNGIALSPDEKTLYVAQSDPAAKIWFAFPVMADGTLGDSRIFFDATAVSDPGSADGMKVDIAGNLWATGPGGVWVFSPDGTPLGRIRTGERISNCAFGGPDRSILYLTSDMYIARIQTKSKGHTLKRSE